MQVDVACVTVRNNGPFVIVLVASELDSIVDQGATLPSATLTSRVIHVEVDWIPNETCVLCHVRILETNTKISGKTGPY